MRIVYIPNSSDDWEEFLLEGSNHEGRGITGYRGDPYQRGAGLGSFFRGLFKAAVPLLRRATKAVGKEALRTGVGIIGDVVRGGELLPSLELHGREAVGVLADKAKAFLDKQSAVQTGGRLKNRKLKSKKQTKRKFFKTNTETESNKSVKGAKSKRAKGYCDIFDNVQAGGPSLACEQQK